MNRLNSDDLDAAYPAIEKAKWGLDPTTIFLNHGSFGACPLPILAKQAQIREQLESNPLRYLLDVAPGELDRSKGILADLVNGPPEDIVFVQSATAGVNAVLRSLDFEPGDEILFLNHSYNACINVVKHVCKKTGAVPVVAKIPWPIKDSEEAIAAIAKQIGARTKLAMLDHVTSRTGLLLPIQEMIGVCKAKGVDVLVDGAHAPGQVEVDLRTLGATYYTANCHKWLCGPKASAILYVDPSKQDQIEPSIISHGSQPDPATGSYGDFQKRFEWQGTSDPSAAICAGDAVAFLNGLMQGGLSALMRRNHAMAVGLRSHLCDAWSITPPCPDDMIGAMAGLAICRSHYPTDTSPEARVFAEFEQSIRSEHKIECQPLAIGDPPVFHIRLSCHAYNHGSEILTLIDALADHVDPQVFLK